MTRRSDIHSRRQRNKGQEEHTGQKKWFPQRPTCLWSGVLEIAKLPIRTMEPNRMRSVAACTDAEPAVPPIRRGKCRIGVADRKGAATRKIEA